MIYKSACFTLLCLVTTPAFSAEYIDLPVATFEAQASNIYERIETIIKNPEPILYRFKPAGLKVKDKLISHDQIEFMATKVVLGISKTVLFKGTLDIKSTSARCFLTHLDFMGSGDLIIDNIQSLEMNICTKEKAENHLVATIKSRLEKGSYYGGVIGGIAKSIITDQVDPIITAIKEEIEK